MKNSLILCFSILFSVAGNLAASPLFKQNTTRIPEVRITLKRSNNVSKGANTEIGTKQIQSSSNLTLTELLQDEQSAARLTNTSGDSQTAISIRGFGDNAAQNSLVIIDGFTLTNPSLLAPNLNAISLMDIERIDIIQGSNSVLYGDQAVGGVIQLVTKTPKQFYRQVIIGLGHPFQHYTALNVGNRFSDNVFLKTYLTVGENDHSRAHNREGQKNALVQIGKEYENGITRITIQRYEDNVQLPGGLNYFDFQHHPFKANNYQNNLHYTTTILQIFNQQTISDNWLLETRLMHHDTNINGLVFYPISENDSTNKLTPVLKGRIKNTKILFGFDIEKTHYHFVRKENSNTVNATEESIFLHSITPLSQLWDITVGIREIEGQYRIDKNNVLSHANDRVFLSEQGVSFHPTQEFSAFVRRSDAVSFPKANEQTLSRGNLQVERGQSYEAGIIYSFPEKSDKFQVNLYQLELKNEIDFNPDKSEDFPFGRFANLAKTKRQGIAVSEQYHFNDAVTLNGQVNFVDARFAAGENKGKLIPGVPAINANAGVNYLFNQNWQAKYRALYTGARFPSQNIKNEGSKLPAYLLHDIALQYLYNTLTVSIEVNNVFNKVYPKYVFYNNNNKNNTYYTGDGRNFLLTIKMDL